LNRVYLALLLAVILYLPQGAFAQSTIIKGKVTDAENGDPVPFANVYFKGTTMGTTTDFDGNYKMVSNQPEDSLAASYIGYLTKVKKVRKGGEQTINFQLKESSLKLDEIVVTPGENPAWEILRRVMDRKFINDKNNLKAYNYEAYTKLEVDIDNISGKFKKRKAAQKILAAIDSLDKLAGEDGKPIIPLFISETMSDVFYRSSPKLKKEVIRKTRVRGVGVEDGTTVSQVIGTTFQEYNFYNNWLNIMSKQFVSPISDFWKLHYEYELLDSVEMGLNFAYKIRFEPKRKQDLAFSGTMWVNKDDYALLRIEVRTGKKINLNFIEKVAIQQELQRTEAGAYLPSKNRILVDFADLSESWAGLLAKFYTSYKNIEVNKPKMIKFFDQDVEVQETANLKDEGFWQTNRHDSLTVEDKKAFNLIDTLRNVPVVKTYVEIANIVVNGYQRIGYFDFGPYLYSYAYNNVEGNRIRLGGKTNYTWSKSFTFEGYVAYGTLDNIWKYNLGAEKILSRKHWTVVGAETRHDLEQLGLIDNSVFSNPLFMAFARLGDLTNSRPFYQRSSRIYFQTELVKGLNVKVSGQFKNFNPVKNVFNFSYLPDLKPLTESSPGQKEDFLSAEFTAEIRYGRDELYIQNENTRVSHGPDKYPVFVFRYDRGVKGILGSDLNYHKFTGTVIQYVNYGLLGNARIIATGGLVPTVVPYPVLRAHMGNQTPFMNLSNYNLMNYFEFISDRFVSLNYQHYFEGFLLNSVPAIKKLRWRLVAHGNALYGTVAQNKIDIIPPDAVSNSTQFESLGRAPYMEVGYGVENIFKLLRIDFVHRLTYLDKPNIKRFGVKASVQFKL